MRKSNLVLLAAVVAALAGGSTAHALSPVNNVTITPSSMGTWSEWSSMILDNTPGGHGTADITPAPPTPIDGSGSAHLTTDDSGGGTHGDESAQLRDSTTWVGTKISSLTALSYKTYATSWNGQQLPYLTLYVDTNNDGSYDDRFIFEPSYSAVVGQGPVALNTWQTWNCLTGTWYSDNAGGSPGDVSGVSLATLLASEPNATIVDVSPGFGGIRLLSGFASPGDDFNAYVDDFTIGTASQGTTVYNFEPNATPEPASLGILTVGALGLLAKRRRAR